MAAHERFLHWLLFDRLGIYMRLIVSVVFSLEKNGGKWPFFQAATTGLGKYSIGGYSRIGV